MSTLKQMEQVLVNRGETRESLKIMAECIGLPYKDVVRERYDLHRENRPRPHSSRKNYDDSRVVTCPTCHARVHPPCVRCNGVLGETDGLYRNIGEGPPPEEIRERTARVREWLLEEQRKERRDRKGLSREMAK